jgi:hypothetical protein
MCKRENVSLKKKIAIYETELMKQENKIKKLNDSISRVLMHQNMYKEQLSKLKFDFEYLEFSASCADEWSRKYYANCQTLKNFILRNYLMNAGAGGECSICKNAIVVEESRSYVIQNCCNGSGILCNDCDGRWDNCIVCRKSNVETFRFV